MAEYLALKKSEQDDHKDIGGFVAGTLSGSRYKAGAVTECDLITLDFTTYRREVLTRFYNVLKDLAVCIAFIQLVNILQPRYT